MTSLNDSFIQLSSADIDKIRPAIYTLSGLDLSLPNEPAFIYAAPSAATTAVVHAESHRVSLEQKVKQLKETYLRGYDDGDIRGYSALTLAAVGAAGILTLTTAGIVGAVAGAIVGAAGGAVTAPGYLITKPIEATRERRHKKDIAHAEGALDAYQAILDRVLDTLAIPGDTVLARTRTGFYDEPQCVFGRVESVVDGEYSVKSAKLGKKGITIDERTFKQEEIVAAFRPYVVGNFEGVRPYLQKNTVVSVPRGELDSIQGIISAGDDRAGQIFSSPSFGTAMYDMKNERDITVLVPRFK